MGWPWQHLHNRRHGTFCGGYESHYWQWEKTLFLESTWVHGARPKDIAPLIFDLSKRKICTVAKALEEDFWVTQINHDGGLSLEHLLQFAKLWRWCKKCIWITMGRTQFVGSSQMMDVTLPSQLIACNFLDTQNPQCLL
jgi:hypothetical protein